MYSCFTNVCRPYLSVDPNPIWGRGNNNAKIMVVGQDPGHTERDQNKVFVGRSRKVLEELFLPGFGIPLESVFITNMVKCWGCAKVPPQVVIENCMNSVLCFEIAARRPEMLILLGNLCVRAFMGKDYPSVTESHGKMENILFHGREIIAVPFYHPGYYLYARNKRHTVEDQVARDGQLISKVAAQFI